VKPKEVYETLALQEKNHEKFDNGIFVPRLAVQDKLIVRQSIIPRSVVLAMGKARSRKTGTAMELRMNREFQSVL